MQSFLLQDWTTVTGDNTAGGGVTKVAQNPTQYLDLSGYQDVEFWYQVGSVSGGTVKIHFETAPDKYEPSFTDLLNISYTHGSTLVQALTANLGTTVNPGSALTPLARWVRWRMEQTSGGAVVWSITFRIFVCGCTYQ